jgi:hypothetical protein
MRRILSNKEDVAGAKEYLDHLQVQDSSYLIVVKKASKPRSLKQNSIFHAIISAFAQDTGYEAVELKDYFKRNYGVVYESEMFGTLQWSPKSTADYTSAEMSGLIDAVYRVSSEMGYYYPRPGEPTWNEFCALYGG